MPGAAADVDKLVNMHYHSNEHFSAFAKCLSWAEARSGEAKYFLTPSGAYFSILYFIYYYIAAMF